MTLYSQSEVENPQTSPLGQGWQANCGNEVLEILRSEDQFPCFFSRNACKRRKLLFSFVQSLEPDDLEAASADLSEYLARSQEWDGDVATAEPLVMQFSPETVTADSVEDYHMIGWDVLQYFHDTDPADWPDDVATDPNSPFWSMCYSGVQIFVNMSVPLHKKRRSRHLGSALTFIINPRERFDIVAGDTPQGQTIRDRIRTRIHRYDGQPHSALLGHYQMGEIEWWQYGLPETDGPRPSGCPLKMRPEALTTGPGTNKAGQK